MPGQYLGPMASVVVALAVPLGKEHGDKNSKGMLKDIEHPFCSAI
jgi:hypothetical protein